MLYEFYVCVCVWVASNFPHVSNSSIWFFTMHNMSSIFALCARQPGAHAHVVVLLQFQARSKPINAVIRLKANTDNWWKISICRGFTTLSASCSQESYQLLEMLPCSVDLFVLLVVCDSSFAKIQENWHWWRRLKMWCFSGTANQTQSNSIRKYVICWATH